MTRRLAPFTIVALLLFLAGPALAQQSSSPRPSAGAMQPAPVPPEPGPWMGPGMGAMHEMMHGGSGTYGGPGGWCGPMAGMYGIIGQQLDPKTRGLLMQMHGETMKAVGDVMIKYGKMFESQPR